MIMYKKNKTEEQKEAEKEKEENLGRKGWRRKGQEGEDPWILGEYTHFFSTDKKYIVMQTGGF